MPRYCGNEYPPIDPLYVLETDPEEFSNPVTEPHETRTYA